MKEKEIENKDLRIFKTMSRILMILLKGGGLLIKTDKRFYKELHNLLASPKDHLNHLNLEIEVEGKDRRRHFKKYLSKVLTWILHLFKSFQRWRTQEV